MPIAVNELPFLRQLYAAIVQGYAVTEYEGHVVYIRHFSSIEQAEIDDEFIKFWEDSKNKGLLTEKDRLEILNAESQWTSEEETDIGNKEFYISNLHQTKRVEYLPSRIEAINVQIQEAEKELRERQGIRRRLLGMTCESYSYQKINEIYIYKSLFRDRFFNNPFFDNEEYAALDREEVDELVSLYNRKMKNFSDKNIRKIALAPFFQNFFFLCNDSIYELFGKPIVNLTFYQSELAKSAKYYRHILSSENKPPQDVMTDPDRLEDWYSGINNAKKMMGDSKAVGEGGGMALVGATASDLETLGLKKNNPNTKTIQEAAGAKGSLSMDDFLAMSGLPSSTGN